MPSPDSAKLIADSRDANFLREAHGPRGPQVTGGEDGLPADWPAASEHQQWTDGCQPLGCAVICGARDASAPESSGVGKVRDGLMQGAIQQDSRCSPVEVRTRPEPPGGRSHLRISHTTVGSYLRRAREAGGTRDLAHGGVSRYVRRRWRAALPDSRLREDQRKERCPKTEPCQCDSMTGARPNRAEDSSARPSHSMRGRLVDLLPRSLSA